MTIQEAIKARHSVRAYLDKSIPGDLRSRLDTFVEECNEEGNLHISIRYDDPEGFDSHLAHYGTFKNVNNYIILAGKKADDFHLRCGYYGEKIVLFAQQLGLNTCWVAMTFNKKKVRELLKPKEALCMVIALGYGETQGNIHKSKKFREVSSEQNPPYWYKEGVKAALLAPTAVNQQKFLFGYENGQATLKAKGFGAYLQTDLGIVKYHFEVISGHEVRI